MAMMEDNFEKLFDLDDNNSSTEKVIESFYDGKNINMKTELPKQIVILMSVLEAYAGEMRRMGLRQSANLVLKILELFKEQMVSADRQGRKEALQMLGAVFEKLKSAGVLSKVLGVEKG